MPLYLSDIDTCYIHIPKTWGMWTKRVLGQIQHGGRDGSMTHHLPIRFDYGKMFCTVRDPADWLASVWGHRIRLKWEPYTADVPWQWLLKLFKDTGCEHNKFEDWIDLVTERLPNIVGWFYGIYTPPRVEPVRVPYDIHDYLKGLGCNPSLVPAINAGYNSPEVTPEIRQKVYLSEMQAYERYGFPKPSFD
jgi:hypothetical protein